MLVVQGVLTDLDLARQPVLMVYNKVDRLTHAEEESFRQRVAVLYPGPSVFVSAIETDGLATLREELLEQLRARRPAVRLDIDAGDGQSLATLYREGEVLDREENGASVRVLARLPDATLGRLRKRGVRLADGP